MSGKQFVGFGNSPYQFALRRQDLWNHISSASCACYLQVCSFTATFLKMFWTQAASRTNRTCAEKSVICTVFRDLNINLQVFKYIKTPYFGLLCLSISSQCFFPCVYCSSLNHPTQSGAPWWDLFVFAEVAGWLSKTQNIPALVGLTAVFSSLVFFVLASIFQKPSWNPL